MNDSQLRNSVCPQDLTLKILYGVNDTGSASLVGHLQSLGDLLGFTPTPDVGIPNARRQSRNRNHQHEQRDET